jgi:hypothetical protein
MKNFSFFLLYFILKISLLPQNESSANFYNDLQLITNNKTEQNRIDELVKIKLSDIKSISPNFNEDAFIVYDGEKELASQVYTKNGTKQILFVINLAPKEDKVISFKFLPEGKLNKEYPARTYAEVAMKFDAVYNGKIFAGDEFQNFSKVIVPEIHTDHNALFKYEGPGWESELVGYRFYIDWRNATDIFGKKVKDLVLHKVGINDLVASDDSYHRMQEWGMDILKVGQTLGIGSIGMMHGDSIYMVSNRGQVICEIPANGPLLSEVKTVYNDWKVGDKEYDLESSLSISAGSRLTNAELLIEGGADNITTGIAKHENTVFIKSETDDNWQYFATYGQQSLSGDNLGIVIFYEQESLKQLGEYKLNYFVTLTPDNGKVNYMYAAAWEQENGGIKTFNDFQKYVENTIEKLNNPIIIESK